MVPHNASFSLPEEWEESYDPDQERFVGPQMDSFFAAQVFQDERQSVAEPGFLQKYGQYLIDYDWFEMLAFTGPATTPELIVQAYTEVKATALSSLTPPVVVAFFCIDGLVWEMFTADDRLLEVVRDHLASDSAFSMEEISPRESHLG